MERGIKHLVSRWGCFPPRASNTSSLLLEPRSPGTPLVGWTSFSKYNAEIRIQYQPNNGPMWQMRGTKITVRMRQLFILLHLEENWRSIRDTSWNEMSLTTLSSLWSRFNYHYCVQSNLPNESKPVDATLSSAHINVLLKRGWTYLHLKGARSSSLVVATVSLVTFIHKILITWAECWCCQPPSSLITVMKGRAVIVGAVSLIQVTARIYNSTIMWSDSDHLKRQKTLKNRRPRCVYRVIESHSQVIKYQRRRPSGVSVNCF